MHQMLMIAQSLRATIEAKVNILTTEDKDFPEFRLKRPKTMMSVEFLNIG